jgi:hypothetical protein
MLKVNFYLAALFCPANLNINPLLLHIVIAKSLLHLDLCGINVSTIKF